MQSCEMFQESEVILGEGKIEMMDFGAAFPDKVDELVKHWFYFFNSWGNFYRDKSVNSKLEKGNLMIVEPFYQLLIGFFSARM